MNAILLWPEVGIRVPNLNDDATHFILVARASDALARGENVIDHWVPATELGFPWFHYYQHLPHLAVVALHRLLLGTVDLFTVFDLVRYALLVGLPLTVFWSLRRMGFGLPAATIAAAGSSLFSAGFRYGIEYDSFLWRGFGLYTQLWATHLTLVVVACLVRWLWAGRGWVPAVAACAALALSHLLYAYMAAVTAAVVFLVQARPSRLPGRAARAALVALPVAALSSYVWLPFLLGRAHLAVSPYLQREKFDSYGAEQIVRWLVQGQLTDAGRAPVLLALGTLGLGVAIATRRAVPLLGASLLGLWLVLYFGRPTLGPLVGLLPLGDGLLLHRFIGGVHLGILLLVGVGGATLWEAFAPARSPRRLVLATAACLAVLAPALAERADFYAQNEAWMRETRAAIVADPGAESALAAIGPLAPGRTYAGLRSNWGVDADFGLEFNSVRLYDLLAFQQIPSVAAPYGSASLNADLLFHFDEARADHHDVFGVRYVVAPRERIVLAGLATRHDAGGYAVREAPSRGYAELVEIVERTSVPSQTRLFELNRAWLLGPRPAERRYVRYDYPAAEERTSPAREPGCPDGIARTESVAPSRLVIRTRCASGATVVVKQTYHPNWTVTIDGAPAATYMVSPSYLAVSLPPGEHTVALEYRSSSLNTLLLVLGAFTVVAVAVLRKRRVIV